MTGPVSEPGNRPGNGITSDPEARPLLDTVPSIKVKLGLLVAASVVVATVVASIGAGGGVPLWLSLPVTVALALGITQLLASGMTSPLREMTAAARRMARGDYSSRVSATSSDEVGELGRAFNTMAHDLATVDRQRRELVANVSHEIRTPLAALCAVLENLVDGVVEPAPQTLRTTLEQAERLSALAADLLDLARVESGKVELATTQLPVQELLGRCVAEARATGRDVTYDVSVSPDELTVRADPARLQQLVANLLDNASRHSPSAAVVRIGARLDGSDWVLEVADEGPGIPTVDRDRVFERFGTLTETEGGGGTGLGLAIARWVAELHGGSIAFVDPEPGSFGARVRVALPLRPTATSTPSTTTGRSRALTEPRSQEIAMSTPTTPRPPAPTNPTPAQPEPGFDSIFGRFWPEQGLRGNTRALLACLGVGVLAAIVLPFHGLGFGTFMVLLAAGAVVLGFSTNRHSPFTLTCAAVCVLLAATVVIRDAEWIVVLCLLTGGVLCLAGLVNGRTLPGFVLAGISLPLAGLRGLPWLGRSARGITGQGASAAAIRTVVLSLAGVLVFGLLFASADALFAEWIGALVPDLELDSFVLRAFITVAVGGVVLATTYVGLNPPRVDTDGGTPRPVANRYEWLAPVLLIDAIFAIFLVAQATVIFGGHDYLERTTGLTYAEYVHQGFGQLTVATALTLLVVWAAGRKAPRRTAADLTWLRGSLGMLCALTLVVVASALYRMHVYQEAYGFTQLRLLVDVFEGWLGLMVLGVMVAGIRLRANWLPRAALLSGAGLLLALAAINPDAWIAQKNLDRYAETGKVDWDYLGGLSADAVPLLATLPDDIVECALMGHGPGSDDAWLEWNLGRDRAAPILEAHLADWNYDDAICRSSGSD